MGDISERFAGATHSRRQRIEGSEMPGNARVRRSSVNEGEREAPIRPSSEEQKLQQENQPAPVKVVTFGRPTQADARKRANSIERAMDVAIGDEGEPWDEEEAA
jgi:hypothetical protein